MGASLIVRHLTQGTQKYPLGAAARPRVQYKRCPCTQRAVVPALGADASDPQLTWLASLPDAHDSSVSAVLPLAVGFKNTLYRDQRCTSKTLLESLRHNETWYKSTELRHAQVFGAFDFGVCRTVVGGQLCVARDMLTVVLTSFEGCITQKSRLLIVREVYTVTFLRT